MTTQELIDYYAKLLIIQYLGLPRAYATIQATAKPILMAQASLADPILPLAVQDAFDPNTAVGVQLDAIGKYQGVDRYGYDFNGNPITLSDSDFRKLINFAIIQNNGGSSFSEIQALINQFFSGQVYVFEYANMRISYVVDSDFGSQSLVQILVTEGLLPKPMGVQLAVTILAPVINKFFGFRTYDWNNTFATPFNSYVNNHANYLWLSYQNSVLSNDEILTEAFEPIVQEDGGFIYLG